MKMLERIRDIGYRLQFTKSEQSVILFLVLVLIIGVVVTSSDTIFHWSQRPSTSYDYTSFDREFQAAERAAASMQPLSEEQIDTLARRMSDVSLSATREKKTRAVKAPSHAININTATESQLMQLPGVGAATAKLIIEYRTQHGRFKRIDDIQKVKSIGPKKFEKMRAFLTVQ